MRRMHIVGGKNHGKTTLLCELITHFHAIGLRVGTIKHTHHRHELDTPGKDSHRHRESGSAVVGILTKSMSAVFWPSIEFEEYGADRRYQAFAPSFRECDLVLVEGDTQCAAPKIEVWRKSLGTPPMLSQLSNVQCLVTDDLLDCNVPVLPRGDLCAIADFVWNASL